MTYHHHSHRTVDDEILKPAYRGYVEMVGRLVEEQHVGLLKKEFCELDAHAPAARKLACGTIEIAALKSETEKSLLDILLKVGHVDGIEFLAHGGYLLDESHIGVGFIVGAGGEFVVQSLDFCLHGVEMGKSLRSLLKDSVVVFGHEMLRKIAHSAVARHRYRPARGIALTGENF